MELFLKRSGGSITVLVTLILVPTIFFTGFLVDLSRLKLYGNQAVMTADNYGETVISQYDNLLKELYGLFAVTQDQEAISQLDNLQNYVKSSFNPASNSISWEYLKGVQNIAGVKSLEGFMPYQSAEVALSYEFVENANLRSHEIMSTQIGDFMKFRIAQQLLGDGSDIIAAVDSVQKMEKDAKAIDKKLEMDKKAEEIFEAAQKFYSILKDLVKYPEYIKGINQAYSDCETKFLQITDSDSYKTYYAYHTSDQEMMKSAVEKRDRIEDGEEETQSETEPGEDSAAQNSPNESLSEEEQRLMDIYDAYMEDESARKDKLVKLFDQAIKKIQDSADAEPINFNNYTQKISALENSAREINNKGADLDTLREQMRSLIHEEDVTEKLKVQLQKDLDRMDELFSQLEYYTGIAEYIEQNNTSVNSSYKQQTAVIIAKMQEIKDSFLDCEENESDWPEILDSGKWKRFEDKIEYNTLYQSLIKCFESKDSSAEESKKKKKAANELLKEAESELEAPEESTARDIPASFGYGTSYHGGFDLGDLIGEAVECFSANNFLNEANKLLLKLYTVEYDFGMFSSRVTNVEEGTEDGETQVSLTGYEKAANINYLYQAELEYILGGSDSSKDNLNAARDKILAIRAVANFTATYSVDEINNLIQGISDAATAINPVLGLVVNGALRLAVAGVETAADWKELKTGKSVVLIKNELKHMTSLQNEKVRNLLGFEGEQEGSSAKEGIRMDYEQYLMVMLVFLTSSDTIAERTANLIELNVNAVQQNIGKEGTLSELQFKMKDAHTAVNATCTVHLDFVVMPKVFAQSVVSDETYHSLENFEKNSYKFTVTRGY